MQNPNSILIRNAKIINEGTIVEGDVLIENEYIRRVEKKELFPKTTIP